MFDIGFGELVLIFLVALVVLGPERLPTAAAAMGRFVGRARGYLRGFMQQLEEEARQADLRPDLDKLKEDLKPLEELKDSIRKPYKKKPPHE